MIFFEKVLAQFWRHALRGMCRVRRVHTESVLKEKMVRCVKVNLISCVCFEVCKVLLGAHICKSYFELVERIISIMRDGNNHV